MANSAYQHIRGMPQLTTVLQGLPREMQQRILVTAVGEAAKPIVRRAKQLAPRDTGALRRSITHITKNYAANNKAVAIAGPDRGYYHSGKRLKKGSSRNGANRPANYAHLVEFGHHSAARSGVTPAALAAGTKGKTRRKGTLFAQSFVLPQPFIRPAVMGTHSEQAAAFTRGIGKGVATAREKLISAGAHAA